MILIIGAGPAGLAAAHFAKQPYRLIETEIEPGGLCRSFTVGGCTFDIGGHAFFTKDSETLSLLEAGITGGFYVQPRRAFVHSHDTWLPYPFQANLAALPREVISECLAGLNAITPLPPDRDDLASWLLSAFGPGITKHFMRPYNQKVWAWPLEEIRCDWAGARIVKPEIRSIIEGAKTDREFRDFDNAEVRYPHEGGFESIFRPLWPASNSLMLKSKVIEVDPIARKILLENGDRIPYTALVSTMPLDCLTAITVGAGDEMKSAAQKLSWNSLYLASFAVENCNPTDWQRVYSASLDVPFHKLAINTNSSPALRREPRTGIQAEISFSHHKKVDRDNLLETTWSAIARIGICGPDAHAAYADLRVVDRAYPIATLQSKDVPTFLTKKFADIGIFCAGRFGQWQYVNSDKAFKLGQEAIQKAELYSSQFDSRSSRADWQRRG